MRLALPTCGQACGRADGMRAAHGPPANGERAMGSAQGRRGPHRPLLNASAGGRARELKRARVELACTRGRARTRAQRRRARARSWPGLVSATWTPPEWPHPWNASQIWHRPKLSQVWSKACQVCPTSGSLCGNHNFEPGTKLRLFSGPAWRPPEVARRRRPHHHQFRPRPVHMCALSVHFVCTPGKASSKSFNIIGRFRAEFGRHRPK